MSESECYTATEVQDIVASPHFRAAIQYSEGEATDPTPACISSVETLFECLGEPFTECFIKAHDNCETVAQAAFCNKVGSCVSLIPEGTDCSSELTAVEKKCADSSVFQELLSIEVEEGSNCDVSTCPTEDDTADNDIASKYFFNVA